VIELVALELEATKILSLYNPMKEFLVGREVLQVSFVIVAEIAKYLSHIDREHQFRRCSRWIEFFRMDIHPETLNAVLQTDPMAHVADKATEIRVREIDECIVEVFAGYENEIDLKLFHIEGINIAVGNNLGRMKITVRSNHEH
jgi:hypothetical protein